MSKIKKENRNSRIYFIESLYNKYKAYSQTELYDACTDSEWERIVQMPDYCSLLVAAKSLHVKKQLTLQRKNRWDYVVDYVGYYHMPNQDEINEVEKIFKKNKICIVKFAKALKFVLEMKFPKINSIKLWGVPNSGKSLIGNAIVKPFVTCYMNNHGSENEFFISNMLHKSMILCEELYITIATAEDFKSILGGQPIDVAKKHEEKQLLGRTPVVITSNYQKFGRGHLATTDENALNIRCYVFNFVSEYKPEIYIQWWNFYFCMLKHVVK